VNADRCGGGCCLCRLDRLSDRLDTIYAHQDAEDDALIGIKSTALLFAARTLRRCWCFTPWR